MITASFRYDAETRELCFAAKGHAGQAERGQDIVCSSASILMFTLAHFVRNMFELGSIKSEPKIILDEGDASVICKCEDDEIFTEAFQTYSVIKLGYSILAHNYPQYVRLEP